MGIKCARGTKQNGVEELASRPVNAPLAASKLVDSAIQLDDQGEMERMSLAASMASLGGDKLEGNGVVEQVPQRMLDRINKEANENKEEHQGSNNFGDYGRDTYDPIRLGESEQLYKAAITPG